MEQEAPSAQASVPVEPGRLTALLHELAAAPEERDGDWARELHPGEQVGRFRISRLIDRGGFGVVYQAEDETLHRPVALKTVRTDGPRARPSGRVEVEAETAARLSHPNIVTLFDVGRAEQGPYLVMELLQGESLAARLARGPPPVRLPVLEAVRIAAEVARGLAHAHGQGVIHRDLKPGNVFLCDGGMVKVVDFGLAHAFGQRRVDGGTPGYMAPEQRAGAPEDERTDVFALGVLLYQMLTGKLPLGATGIRPSRRRAPPLEIAASPALAELVERMLESDPVRRPRDGGEVAEALEAIRRELDQAPSAPSAPVRARRRWRLAATALAASLATAAVAWVIVRRSSTEAPPAIRVALADVVNETGEPELDVSGLLRTVLEQSATLDFLPRARLVDALRDGPEAEVPRLDEHSGAESARRCGARSLVLARLLRFGAAYLMEVRVVDPDSGARRFSFTEQQAGKENVPELVDRAAEQVRLRLGESPDSIRLRAMPARALTSSMVAWQRYSAGMACFERHSFAGSFEDCLTEFQDAVAIDPGFVLAHLQLSQVRFLQGKARALQKAALAQALRSPERVPPHDRKRLRGWEAYLDGRELEAKVLLREAAEEAPDDKHAWYLAGEIPYHRDEFAEALPFFRQVHALDPFWVDASKHLALALGATGDQVGLRALISELAALGPRPQALLALCGAQLWTDTAAAVAACEHARSAGADADNRLAIALLNSGDRARLKRHLAELEQGKRVPSFGWYMSLWLLGQEGRWPEWRRRAAMAGDPEDSWFHSTMAEMALGSGGRDRAWQEALRILELDRAMLSNLAVHLAYQGDLEHAAELSGYLPPGSPRVAVYEALVRWRRGDLAGAIEPLRRVAAGAPLSVAPEIPAPLYLLGEALAESGRDAEAADALRRFLALPLDNPTWLRPRALYLLGRSLDRLGDREGARQAIGTLLELWRGASSEQPLLAEARELGSRLGLR